MRRLRQLRSSTIIIAIAVVLVVVNGLGWVSVAGFAQDAVRPISAPLSRLGQTLGIQISAVLHVGSLNNTNRQLETQNQQLLSQVANLKDVEQQNEQLRKQLQFVQTSGRRMVGADVIAFQPDGVRQLLGINRGTDDGIKNGMIVVSAGQLVGKVQNAGAHSAQVLLASDEQFKTLVVDQNTQTPGIVKGQVGSSVVMERIPQNQKISQDDLIVTSGADGEFPAGLVVGTVSGVTQDAQSIFQSAQIKQAFAPLELRVIMVIVQP